MNTTSERDNNLSNGIEGDSDATNEESGSSPATDTSPYSSHSIVMNILQNLAGWPPEPVSERRVRRRVREKVERQHRIHAPDQPSADDLIESELQNGNVIRNLTNGTLQVVTGKKAETVELEIGGKVRISKILTEIQSESGGNASEQRK